MITVKMIKYYNDYHRLEQMETFQSLDELADWIFSQTQLDYSSKEWSCAVSFPECGDERYIRHISVMKECGGPTFWIKQIEDGCHNILFSDGTYTAGQKRCAKAVSEWLASCEQRKHAPKFRFVDDRPGLGVEPATAGDPMGRIKKAACRIHMAGGCDAADEYAKGYDDAIALALDILFQEAGLTFDDVMDYSDSLEA